MPYVALAVLALVAVLFGARLFVSANPARLARAFKIVGVVVAGGVAIYLIAAGRIGIATLVLGALPFILRWRAIARAMKNARGPTPGRTSEVATRYLRVQLDHDTGAMSGTVLQGVHRGRALEALSTPEIIDLLTICRAEDPQGVALLETYLDRTDPDWRGAAGPNEGEPPSGTTPMGTDEAYRILGLSPGASAAEVKRAHRDLMQKVHPDRGGSHYLAAKINEAKDLLLRT